MEYFIDNIDTLTTSNQNFRQVLFTGNHMQLVVMNLLPGEEIGLEVHQETDQFFRVEHGEAKVIINGKENIAQKDYAFIVPAGSKHNIINNSQTENLSLYTIYAPPNHPEGTIHKTKLEADVYEKSHH